MEVEGVPVTQQQTTTSNVHQVAHGGVYHIWGVHVRVDHLSSWQEAQERCTLVDVPEGLIGKLRVHKSGKVK